MVVALMLAQLVPVPPAEAASFSISILYPNGGDRIVSGATVTVRWSVSDNGGYIAVQLSTDKGVTFDTLKAVPNTAMLGMGEWEWFVDPRINSTTCRVRLVWVSALMKPYTEYARDESESDVSIQPSLIVYFKDVPTRMTFGGYNLTTWELFDPQHMVGSLRFTWRVDDGSGYGPWAPLEGGRFSSVPPTQNWIWWTPDYYASATAEVRVEAVHVGTGAVIGIDVTPPIAISSPTVSLFRPDCGDVLVGGTDFTIEWRSAIDPDSGVIGASLEYSTDGGSTWTYIAMSTDDDGSYAWRVPTEDHPSVLVRVSLLHGEWLPFTSDTSSVPSRMIRDSGQLTVTLVEPNPPFEHGVMWKHGERHRITWSTTGPGSDIRQFKLYYSVDSGAHWTLIQGATAPARWYEWDVPDVYTEHARCRVELVPVAGASILAVTAHDFILFNTDDINRPPTARATAPATAAEDEVVLLDGSASEDPDGDPLTYSWRQTSPHEPAVAIADAGRAKASFSVGLSSYPVTFVFNLQVSDGIPHEEDLYPLTNFSLSVEVVPRPPSISSVEPDSGWAGTPLTVKGADLRGAEVLMGGVSLARVPEDPVVPLNPQPDTSFTFYVPATAPHGAQRITLRTMAGEATSDQEVEIYPVPQWNLDWGLGFHNPTTYTLSYPWDPWDTGRYKDAFGDQVYLCLWICIGLPWWDPWNGWVCLGYEIEEPFCPDPIAAIYYGAVFCWIARYGECFGMSTTALRLYHGEISARDYGPTSDPSDLPGTGELRRQVDYQQGGEMSSEVLNAYLDTLIGGLVPSSPISGLGGLLTMMESSIDSGELGIVTIICDEGAHAMVPYAYEDVDPTHTRVYVYDSNRPHFSDPATAIDDCLLNFSQNDHPPYIEFDKSGYYWSWSFEWPSGTVSTDEVGMAFVPWGVVRGGRTLPLSIEGITTLLAGSAGVAVEDGGGGSVGYDGSGSLQWGIPGAAPMPMFGGEGSKVQSWYLPRGNYTARINGTADGTYNWSCVNNGTSAFSIESAQVRGSSHDTAKLAWADGNPYRGTLRYGTDDAQKEYTLAQVNRFGVRERVYRIMGADLTATGEHEVGTNANYTGIVFTNHGTVPTTFDVEFQHNVVSEAVWNGTGRPTSPRLPTASRAGITVGPGETVTIRPLSWLDLDHTIVIVEGETAPGAPRDLRVNATGAGSALSWSAPASDGGWPVTRYVVLRGDSEGALAVVGETAGTSFVDAAVEGGRTYWYAVRAVNAVGHGELTPAASVAVPEKGGGGFPWLLVAIAIVAALAVAATAAAVARGRQRGGAPEAGSPGPPEGAGQGPGPPPGADAPEVGTGRPPG